MTLSSAANDERRQGDQSRKTQSRLAAPAAGFILLRALVPLHLAYGDAGLGKGDRVDLRVALQAVLKGKSYSYYKTKRGLKLS